jgi:hypothetical protein
MSETKLNKSFREKDVRRLRNIITGNVGEKSTTGIGYKKKDEIHEEGDVWEEGGRTWTIKNGIKQNITKLDAAKKIHLMPLFCPNCSNVMKGRNDKIFYNIHHKCFNCVVDFEQQLKREGKFDQHLISIHNSQIDNMIDDLKLVIEESKRETGKSFVTEAGDVEEWLGSGQENLEIEVNNAIIYLESLKK